MTERLIQIKYNGIVSRKREETGILCSTYCDLCSQGGGNCEYVSEMIKKLAEYETAEEEGRLVVLPCKVGDTLFCFSRVKIYLFKVRCIRIYEERTEIELWYAGDEENLKFWHITISEQDIGYGFFLTRGEAEKALKEMEVKA